MDDVVLASVVGHVAVVLGFVELRGVLCVERGVQRRLLVVERLTTHVVGVVQHVMLLVRRILLSVLVSRPVPRVVSVLSVVDWLEGLIFLSVTGGVMNGALVEVDWLNIVLVVIGMAQSMVSRMGSLVKAIRSLDCTVNGVFVEMDRLNIVLVVIGMAQSVVSRVGSLVIVAISLLLGVHGLGWVGNFVLGRRNWGDSVRLTHVSDCLVVDNRLVVDNWLVVVKNWLKVSLSCVSHAAVVRQSSVVSSVMLVVVRVNWLVGLIFVVRASIVVVVGHEGNLMHIWVVRVRGVLPFGLMHWCLVVVVLPVIVVRKRLVSALLALVTPHTPIGSASTRPA